MKTEEKSEIRLERSTGPFNWLVYTPTGVRYFRTKKVAESCVVFILAKQKKV